MKKAVSFWQKLDKQKAINATLDLASGPIYEPQPAGNDLYSSLFTLPRSRLRFAGRLAVPNDRCVVIWGHCGFCHTFGPGIHSLRICPPGRLLGRIVDMSQRNLDIRLSSVRTADLAQVSLHINVEFRVDDPQVIIRINSPLQTLARMVESTTRQVTESWPHCSLFGDADGSQLGSKAALEHRIRLPLLSALALNGLRILSIRIVHVEGDPTYLALATQAVLAEQQLLAEEAALQTRRLLAISQRDLALFEAKTERLATLIRKKVALDDAQRQAEIFEQESARREFERMMVETKLVHERAMARIQALGQAVTPLADPGYLAVANATYAHTNYSDGRNQALDRVISKLIEPEASGASPNSNGHSSQ
jgi:hypothetical protein